MSARWKRRLLRMPCDNWPPPAAMSLPRYERASPVAMRPSLSASVIDSDNAPAKVGLVLRPISPCEVMREKSSTKPRKGPTADMGESFSLSKSQPVKLIRELRNLQNSRALPAAAT
eukprot:87558-Heterocapsa_arctica.AAC.1